MNEQGPDGALLKRARSPRIEVSAGGLETALTGVGSYLLLSESAPLAACAPGIAERAVAVVEVGSLGEEALDVLVGALPDAPTVVGLGGSMALDSAKYVAWRRGVRLVLAPSVVSVDACVTNTIAVRVDGIVSHRGFVVADPILLDTDLVRSAPPRLNRAGIGDLVSIHTALWDWRLADAAGSVPFAAVLAGRAGDVLDRAEAIAPQLGELTPDAIEALVRAFAEMNALLLDVGHNLPEEGSEHYLAQLLEALAGRSFTHGELVGMGTVLLATLQGNDPDRPRAILDAARVEWRPAKLGLEPELVVRALAGLRAFAREHDLPYSIADEIDLSAGAAGAVASLG